MAKITTKLLLDVSKALLARWKDNRLENEGLLPDEISLAKSLLTLLSLDTDADEDDSLTKLFENAKDDLDSLLEKIEDSVGDFQKKISELKVDKILGTKTISELLSWIGCAGRQPKNKNPLDPGFKMTDDSGNPTNEIWFHYFIEDAPPISNAHELIELAWGGWKKVALIRSRRVLKKEQANVVFKTRNLTGPVLGQADLGPVGTSTTDYLEVEMDSTRNWTTDLFLGAVAHEIGHILGLEHSPSKGNLMSERISPGIKGPLPDDALRARNLPYSGPPPQDAVDTATDDEIRDFIEDELRRLGLIE
ncbi:Matrixin [Gimesia chilikensis]|uniref:Matrixin n=1 Tax=Gimesia chilikensis TaxID=2605989 RepID=A0A517WKA6_9PLAN|nr:matrixin family metalloprotease [Gimesia chilikensis]QDU05695.1 Matrixin [Gimesia chilikensis]